MVEFNKSIPSVLYKYRIWDNKNDYKKRILTHNEIYLSSAAQFNDPYDVSLPFKYKEEDLTIENLLRKTFETGRRIWPNLSDKELLKKCKEHIDSDYFKNGKYWKEAYPHTKKELHEKFGIFSLSERNNNLLMWSHYANSHKGYCIGLNSKLLCEAVNVTILPVYYGNNIPNIDMFYDDEEVRVKNMLTILTTKSIDWQYENEYRIIKYGAAYTLFLFDKNCIEEIILGDSINENDKEEIIDITKTTYPKAKLYQSKISLECFQLKFELIP